MMNIQSEKLGLIQWIASLQDLEILNKIKQIHNEHSQNTDWWDEISVQEKQSIAAGLRDVEQGNVQAHESVKKIYEKYL